MNLITKPDFGSKVWLDLPREHRTEIRDLLDLFSTAPEKGITKWLQQQARAIGRSYSSLRQKWDDIRHSEGDWMVLIDERKARTGKDSLTGTADPLFIAELLRIVDRYKRKKRPAFRELRRRWRVRDKIIPGYEDWPGWPAIPEGWSDRNLAEIVNREQCKAQRESIRIGTSSKTNPFLPHTLTTRVGLWPGAVIQLDDQWHDNYVTTGKGRDLQVVRGLELGALDLFSAHRFHWGCKPRLRREKGGFEEISDADARLFTAGVLHSTGYSPMGTMLMVENKTMKIAEDIERTLYDATGGLLRVDRQAIEGKQAALSGYWPGTEGGNFRAKAHLESVQNLIRNDLGALEMQMGSFSSGIKGPVTTKRQVAYIASILRDVLKHVPHRADQLRLPTWDFHTQFIPWLTDYYHFGLAMRTDHQLEGWERLGNVVTEYASSPTSGEYLTQADFLALDDDERLLLTTFARKDPAKWQRRRNLCPLEVWNTRPQFNPIGPGVLCEILTGDLARECSARRGFVEFSDREFAPDPLIYQARYISGPRRGENIGHGEKLCMFANPYDDRTALVVDAKGRFLGELPLYKRVLPIDPDAFHTTAPFDNRPDIKSAELKRAAGEKHQRIAEINAPLDIRHAEEVREARDLREHNKAVLDPDGPITPEEMQARREEAIRRGTRTRKDNRLKQALGPEALDSSNLLEDDTDLADDLHTISSDHENPFSAAHLLNPQDNDE